MGIRGTYLKLEELVTKLVIGRYRNFFIQKFLDWY